jgi:hypothetical protein
MVWEACGWFIFYTTLWINFYLTLWVPRQSCMTDTKYLVWNSFCLGTQMSNSLLYLLFRPLGTLIFHPFLFELHPKYSLTKSKPSFPLTIPQQSLFAASNTVPFSLHLEVSLLANWIRAFISSFSFSFTMFIKILLILLTGHWPHVLEILILYLHYLNAIHVDFSRIAGDQYYDNCSICSSYN